MASYGTPDHKRALKLFLTDLTYNGVSEAMGGNPSPKTIMSWADKGLPEEMTGGKTWEEYKDSLARRSVALVKKREEQLTKSPQFMAAVVEKVDDVLDVAYDRLLAGEARLNYADLDKLIRLRLMLSNTDQEKVEWMENTAAQMFKVAFEIMDERQFALFKARMIEMQSKKTKTLDLPSTQV